MNHFLVNTLTVAVVLGVIVIVHELGHFVAAKAFGVRVETFSLGFGKRLWGVRYGGTDYRVCVLPLGGYVRMAGENPLDNAQGQPYELTSKPRWQRFIIAFAGPFMNMVLAVGLLIPVYMHEFPRNSFLDEPAVVAAVEPNSPAAQAGLRPMDRIIRIDGVNNPTWDQFFLRASLAAESLNHRVGVTVLRDGQVVQTGMSPTPNGPDDPPNIGLTPKETTILGEITAASPAQRAGLRPGDQVVAVDGGAVLEPDDLVQRIQATQAPIAPMPLATKGRPFTLEIRRAGAATQVTVTPVLQDNQGHKQWMMGASFASPTTFVHLPFGQAVHHSLEDNQQYGMVIIEVLGKLLSHKTSISNLQSPVGIASVTGDAVRSSPNLLPLFSVTAFISLDLGILNLLPIPVLDGGMILFLIIESILRHEISLKFKERVYQAGFAFLLILMTVAVYNDIIRALVRH